MFSSKWHQHWLSWQILCTNARLEAMDGNLRTLFRCNVEWWERKVILPIWVIGKCWPLSTVRWSWPGPKLGINTDFLTI